MRVRFALAEPHRKQMRAALLAEGESVVYRDKSGDVLISFDRLTQMHELAVGLRCILDALAAVEQ